MWDKAEIIWYRAHSIWYGACGIWHNTTISYRTQDIGYTTYHVGCSTCHTWYRPYISHMALCYITYIRHSIPHTTYHIWYINISHITYDISTYHISHITYHISHITCHIPITLYRITCITHHRRETYQCHLLMKCGAFTNVHQAIVSALRIGFNSLWMCLVWHMNIVQLSMLIHGKLIMLD